MTKESASLMHTLQPTHVQNLYRTSNNDQSLAEIRKRPLAGYPWISNCILNVSKSHRVHELLLFDYFLFPYIVCSPL